jgi:predicted nuclease of restriction endonuclease-like (RecB) superfamily
LCDEIVSVRATYIIEATSNSPSGYSELLAELSTRIRTAQLRASFAVSRELELLYWSIGREILTGQQTEGWGARVIDRLGADLQKESPGVEGYSPRNLKYTRSLAEAWTDPEIVPQLVALLPWDHLRVLLDQLKERDAREWYLRAALEYGWSRNVLVLQSGLRETEGKGMTNFQRSLPPPGLRSGRAGLERPLQLRFSHRHPRGA